MLNCFLTFVHRPDVACVTVENAVNLQTKYEELEKEVLQ